MRSFLLAATLFAIAALAVVPTRADDVPAGDLPGKPFRETEFASLRVTDAWRKYGDRLTWGKGQCLAILDDGCDLSAPVWQVKMPWGPKVIATWDAVDGDEDPSHVPPGYHGTTVGYPSSQNFEGVLGVAFNNHVAHVRAITVVHLRKDESRSLADALQWVIDRHGEHNITTVNLAPVDDQKHQEPLPTAIDAKLERLRELGIWVSAPCGNHHYVDGISWPACQPKCFAIGATVPGRHVAHLDRFSNTDLLAAAVATSSSNAFAAGCAMILREAIEKANFDWKPYGATLPDAQMAIFQKTGREIVDEKSGFTFRELDLLAALDLVFENAR